MGKSPAGELSLFVQGHKQHLLGLGVEVIEFVAQIFF
jgi:hypothetical protein